tara:strand:- start:40 stop:564 length:525 start_codon:yes stop_codon:yes gene_type:complete
VTSTLRVPWYTHGNWKLDKQELKDLEKNLLINKNKRGLYTTYAQNNKHLKFLKNFYQGIVDEICKEQTIYTKSKIKYEFWIQIYDKYSEHPIHDHFNMNQNTVISWVHFLKVTDTTVFRFTDGINTVIPPQEEGDLIVFPSYVSHQVANHNFDFNRIVVAGNISLMSIQEPIIK